MASGRATRPGPDPEQLRLVAKIARMYHERNVRQPQIAALLHISQPRVSRLLKRAVELGVVRTVVTTPAGTHLALEQTLINGYHLADAVVVDTAGAEGVVLPALGAAGAEYLASALADGVILGVSTPSWSLIETVRVMRAGAHTAADKIVQIVGGIGDTDAQLRAAHLVATLAETLGATPVFLPVPGLVETAATRRALMTDGSFLEVSNTWSDVDVAMVEINPLRCAPESVSDVLGRDNWRRLLTVGAIGEVCLRYFDAAGGPVPSPFDDRLIGITREQLLRIPRRIAIAGGEQQSTTIGAALRGAWVNTLITDAQTATELVADLT